MKNTFKRNVSAIIPEKFSDLSIKEPIHHAAGILGVKASLEHGFKEMGVFRSMRALLHMNQEKGFSCPSCAWPDPEHTSKIAEYCESGAKALADEATIKHIGAVFFEKNSVEELSLWTDYELNKCGRIIEPMVLRPNRVHYEPIGWEEAFQLIAEELHELDDPNEAVFYTSGRSSNEAAFLYGIFVRAFGTNNLPDCSNMCHESSGVALGETLGIGKGSVVLEDFYEAEVIIIAGQNPGTNHPRMMSALEKCKKNGGYIISINPLEETGLVNFKNPQEFLGWVGSGEAIADVHLPVQINGDIALIKLILKKLALLDSLDHTIFDHDFIKTYTQGYEDVIEDVLKYDDQVLLEQSGVDEQLINKVVAILAKKSKIIVCWAMGLTQHKNGVKNIREYVNLLLLKGALGKPNAGTCPVRGHSNVQGDRSVGIMHYIDEQFNANIKEHFGFDAPTKRGVDVVECIQAMHEGKAKVFVALGGNFVMAASDTLYTAAAIEKCNLTVQISTKLNRSHLVTGKTALILPTYGRSEKDEKDGEIRHLTIEDSTGRVRSSRGLLRPASKNIMSEPEIIARIAEAYFQGNHPVNWKALGADYDLIREYIDKVARGFKDTTQRAKGHGYYLPNNARVLDFSHLPNGKAQLTINELPNHQLEADDFLLMTIRSHDQFNTTIYGLDDRYRGIYNERRVVFMNQEDMNRLDLKERDIIDLSSRYDNKTRTAYKFYVVPYTIPKGNLAAYFPETNVLVPINQFADRSNTPISKSIVVKIFKRAEENQIVNKAENVY